jgi:hypothetical protein
MIVEGIRRLTVLEQVSRNEALRGRSLAVRVIDPTTGYIVKAAKLFDSTPELRKLIPSANIEVRTPLGLLMDPSVIMFTPSEIDAKAAEMDALFEVANPRQPQKIFPPMLDIAGQTYKRIMVGELTGIEAAQFLRPEDVSGHNADELQLRLREPSSVSLVCTNVADARRYIEAANKEGRRFRFMTGAEFEALPTDVKAQLKGDNWFLVETSRGSDQFNWCSLRVASRSRSPDGRYYGGVVRLVED